MKKLFWLLWTITALAVPARAQTMTPWGELFFTPSTSYRYYVAYCRDIYGNVIPNCNVSISTSNYAGTGGHSHTSPPAPRTSVSPTFGNSGCCGLPLTHTTTDIGQAEYLQVCAVAGCDRSNYVVGYWDFQRVNAANYWVFIGATPTHPDNHWARVGPINAMNGVAVQYRGEFPANPVIGMNDSALIRGGRFDLNNAWSGSHFNHSRGTAFDVRGNGAANSIPPDPFTQTRFMLICGGFGATTVLHENTGAQNEHFHCEWP